MLGHHLRRWTNVKTAVFHRAAFAGVSVVVSAAVFGCVARAVNTLCRTSERGLREYRASTRQPCREQACNNTTCFPEWIPSKHRKFTQCWFDVGPASETLGQQQTSIGYASCLCWGSALRPCSRPCRDPHATPPPPWYTNLSDAV